MRCRAIPVPGGFAIACGGQPRRRRCSVCGELGASKLCDGPPRRRDRRTCDAPLCEKCARKRAPGADFDYCPSCDNLLSRAVAMVEAFANDEKGRPSE
jgi:hypothetical protein